MQAFIIMEQQPPTDSLMKKMLPTDDLQLQGECDLTLTILVRNTGKIIDPLCTKQCVLYYIIIQYNYYHY